MHGHPLGPNAREVAASYQTTSALGPRGLATLEMFHCTLYPVPCIARGTTALGGFVNLKGGVRVY